MPGINEFVGLAVNALNGKVERHIREFGIAADGVTNDAVKVQQAIDEISNAGGGTLYFDRNKKVAFRGKLYVRSNVRLQNPNLLFVSQTCQVYLTGTDSGIDGFYIDSSTHNNSNGGVVEILDATRPYITNGVITGTGLFKGIQCKSRHKDTRIERVEVRGLGWGILFNDGESEQTAGYRTIDNFNYSPFPLGDGLFIDRFTFSPNDGNYGDGIEINAPDYGMRNVKITNCNIKGAYAPTTSDSRGIGIGAANITDLIMSDCTASNTTLDAFHVEKGKYHKVSRCHGYLGGRALGISHTMFTKVIDCTFENCGTWLASYSNAVDKGTNQPYQKTFDLTIKGCSFSGVKPGIESTSFGLIIGYATNVKIQDCTFFEYGGSANPIIQFSNNGNGNVSGAVIERCYFDKGASTVSPTAVVIFNGNDAINNWYKDDNTIMGYGATSISGSTDRNRIELALRRNVTLTGDSSPTAIYRNGYKGTGAGVPTGFMSVREGAEYVNTLNSQRHVANTTAWVAQDIKTV